MGNCCGTENVVSDSRSAIEIPDTIHDGSTIEIPLISDTINVEMPTLNGVQPIKLYKHFEFTANQRKKQSNGEHIIQEYLENIGVYYQAEYHHPNLPDLRYDFIIMYNNTLFFIEFDGEQHFRQKWFFHKTQKAFYLAQQHDRIKMKLLRDISVNIIRIAYDAPIIECLSTALLNSQREYLSDPKKYEYLNGFIAQKTMSKYWKYLS